MDEPARLVVRSTAALGALLLCAVGCTRESPRVRGLVLISIDTLRADHIGVYGGPVSTPNLDRLAAQGVLFENATTPTPTTGPAVASMLTGLYPWHHEVLNNVTVLAAQFMTLAEIAQDAGVVTAGFVSNYMLDERYGFAQGFDTYLFEPTGRYEFPSRELARAAPWGADRGFWAPADAITTAAGAWIERTARDPRPFFLWVHYFDPHAPYNPPANHAVDPAQQIDLSGKSLPRGVKSWDKLRKLVRAYQGEVRFVDAEVGKLLSTLGRFHSLDEIAIVVTSDHGEGLGDHGKLDHGAVLFDEAVRVPLLIRAPGLARGTRLAGPAQLEDLFPTLLALLGLSARDAIDGVDLRPWMSGRHEQSPRRASVGAVRLWFHQRIPLFYERRWPTKWIGPSTGGGKVFDLGADPREARARPARQLPGFIATTLVGARVVPVSEDDLDEESLRGLRALGYIQ